METFQNSIRVWTKPLLDECISIDEEIYRTYATEAFAYVRSWYARKAGHVMYFTLLLCLQSLMVLVKELKNDKNLVGKRESRTLIDAFRCYLLCSHTNMKLEKSSV